MATVEEEASGATRPQRKRKAERRKERPAAGPPEPGYAVGQVAGSLRGSEAGGGPLAALFGGGGGSPAPLYGPAPPAPQQASAPPRKDPAPQPPPPKKARAPPAAAASEALVCAREQALEQADRQEEEARARRRGPAQRRTPRLSPAEERLRERRTVFVGNLPAALTKGALRGLFRGCGAIESVRFRSVARAEPALSRRVAAIQRRLPPGRRSLQAYVVFREEAAAALALARNGAQVPGSGLNMRVDRAAGAPGGQHDARRSAFVGNLPYGLEEQALREHFGPCGPVEAVRIVRDRETGLGKGFGYVLFADADGVQLALRLEGSELLGRRLRVKRCLQLGGPARGASGPGSVFAGCRHSQDSEGKGGQKTPAGSRRPLDATGKGGKRGSAGWRHSQDSAGKAGKGKAAGSRRPQDSTGKGGKKTPAGSRRPQDSERTEGKMKPAKRKVSTQLGGNKPTKRFPKKNKS